MKNTILAAGLLTFGTLPFASAQSAVWDGMADYRVSGNEAKSGILTTDAPQPGYISETLAYNPAVSLLSAGPGVYGGFTAYTQATAEGFTGGLAIIHRGGDTPEVIRLQNAVSSLDRYLGAFVMVRTEAFNAEALAGSTLLAKVTTSQNIGSYRFVVESGGNLFVSEATLSPGATPTDFTLEIGGAQDGNWQMHDFTASFNVNENGVFAPTDFTSISGLGVYYEGASTASGTAGDLQGSLSYLGFTVVPEPSLAALLLGMGAGGIVSWRRVRRSGRSA